MTAKNKVDSVSLRAQLSVLEKAGIKLYLNGIPSNTEYIVKNCVREDTVYMPDYITDEKGNIKEVRYDKISQD
ncbi:MAG: hypothetical protein IJ409_00595 [Lachnospiraceae bacterium]|nr:hypothetical protein [Lachnospiraceae bacterium]